jgi:hypothetical protein
VPEPDVEDVVLHDLRVYAQPHRGEVRFYRDNKAWRSRDRRGTRRPLARGRDQARAQPRGRGRAQPACAQEEACSSRKCCVRRAARGCCRQPHLHATVWCDGYVDCVAGGLRGARGAIRPHAASLGVSSAARSARALPLKRIDGAANAALCRSRARVLVSKRRIARIGTASAILSLHLARRSARKYAQRVSSPQVAYGYLSPDMSHHAATHGAALRLNR